MAWRRWVAGVALCGAVMSAPFPGARVTAQQRVSEHWDEAKLSSATFAVRMEHNVKVPMRDGVAFRAERPLGSAQGGRAR